MALTLPAGRPACPGSGRERGHSPCGVPTLGEHPIKVRHAQQPGGALGHLADIELPPQAASPVMSADEQAKGGGVADFGIREFDEDRAGAQVDDAMQSLAHLGDGVGVQPAADADSDATGDLQHLHGHAARAPGVIGSGRHPAVTPCGDGKRASVAAW